MLYVKIETIALAFIFATGLQIEREMTKFVAEVGIQVRDRARQARSRPKWPRLGVRRLSLRLAAYTVVCHRRVGLTGLKITNPLPL